MADLKITALTALSAPDAADLLTFVDVSDTTMDAGGTNKKTTLAQLEAVLGGGGGGLAVGDAVTGGGANRVLYQDGSSNLAATGALTFTASTHTLTVTNPNSGGGEGGTFSIRYYFGTTLDSSGAIVFKIGGVQYGRISATEGWEFHNSVRDAADDADAAALSPAVPVNGIYRTGSVLKIRVA